MQKEKDIFTGFLKEKGLKLTGQREEVLSAFLKTEKHVSVEELYDAIKKKEPAIGHATVFRTLKLLKDAGIARQVDLGQRMVRYEHKYGHEHHDHLICVNCGRLVEACDERIESLQDALCKRYGFLPKSHKMEIFGLCSRCRKKRK